eukprot:542958-Rhodomonas_salina.2
MEVKSASSAVPSGSSLRIAASRFLLLLPSFPSPGPLSWSRNAAVTFGLSHAILHQHLTHHTQSALEKPQSLSTRHTTKQMRGQR